MIKSNKRGFVLDVKQSKSNANLFLAKRNALSANNNKIKSKRLAEYQKEIHALDEQMAKDAKIIIEHLKANNLY